MDKTEATNRLTEQSIRHSEAIGVLCRIVSIAIIAAYYALVIADTDPAKIFFAAGEIPLTASAILAAVTLGFEFLQHVFGYKVTLERFKYVQGTDFDENKGLYDDSSPSYKRADFFFKWKRWSLVIAVFCFGLGLLMSVVW